MLQLTEKAKLQLIELITMRKLDLYDHIADEEELDEGDTVYLGQLDAEIAELSATETLLILDK